MGDFSSPGGLLMEDRLEGCSEDCWEDCSEDFSEDFSSCGALLVEDCLWRIARRGLMLLPRRQR